MCALHLRLSSKPSATPGCCRAVLYGPTRDLDLFSTDLSKPGSVAVAVVDTALPCQNQISYPVVAYRRLRGHGDGYRDKIVIVARIGEYADVATRLALVCVVAGADALHVLWTPVGNPGALVDDSALEERHLASREVFPKHHELLTVLGVVQSFGIAPSTATAGATTCVVVM
jgi:hypothetical protein